MINQNDLDELLDGLIRNLAWMAWHIPNDQFLVDMKNPFVGPSLVQIISIVGNPHLLKSKAPI